MEPLVSALIVATGGLSLGTGLLLARTRLRAARRVHRKTATLHAAMPDGWGAWFLAGFSGLTLGTHWLLAAASWIVWTLAGVYLIGLGVRLLVHV